MTKDERQLKSINLWKSVNYKGCLQAVTGYGKTRVAINGIQELKKLKSDLKTIVTVPTLALKDQWETVLTAFKIDDTTVIVNNTASMTASELSTDLLICDEVHTIPTATRAVILDIPHQYFLGLSATIKRADANHEFVLEKYPIFDKVEFTECMVNGWISPYTIYNIPVDLSEVDRKNYDTADRNFKHVAAQIGYYSGDTLTTAQEWISSPDKDKQNMAARYYNSMRARKKICIDNPKKLEVIEKIVSLFPDRFGIIFSQSVEFADAITESIGDLSVTFHSKLTKKQQKSILTDFTSKEGKRIISTVQALDAGFDFPELSLAIVAAGYSSQLTNIQRVGRTVRALPDKEAIIINIFTKNTQEERWMTKRQEGFKVVNLESVDSLYEIYSRIPS